MKNWSYLEEKIANGVLLLCSLIGIIALVAILVHILGHGLKEINWTFFTSYPQDMGRKGGIWPIIAATVELVGLSLIFAVPPAILTAIYLSDYSREGFFTRIIRAAVDCLAGIPSIIFGLFGFIFLVSFLGLGWSLISGAITLAVMILPTIVRASEEAIRAVPVALREGSLSLGASRWQTICHIVLPVATPGILTGIILAMGRAIGETAAVLLTAGSTINLPFSLFEPARSLSVHLYILTYEGISFSRGYATAATLIFIILIINSLAGYLLYRMRWRTAGNN